MAPAELQRRFLCPFIALLRHILIQLRKNKNFRHWLGVADDWRNDSDFHSNTVRACFEFTLCFIVFVLCLLPTLLRIFCHFRKSHDLCNLLWLFNIFYIYCHHHHYLESGGKVSTRITPVMYDSQETACGIWFSPPTMCVLGIGFPSAGLAVGWAIPWTASQCGYQVL